MCGGVWFEWLLVLFGTLRVLFIVGMGVCVAPSQNEPKPSIFVMLVVVTRGI